jgi:hypothetical protein
MTDKIVEKDERTTFIEMASYSYGYKFLAFGLLLDIMYRSFRFNEAPWDLFALIIISGFAMTIYQYKQKILGKSWIKTVAFTILIAIISALVLTLIALTK